MVEWAFKTDYLSFSVVCVCKFAHNWIIADTHENMRDLGKSIDYLFLYLSGLAEIGVRMSLLVSVCVCV